MNRIEKEVAWWWGADANHVSFSQVPRDGTESTDPYVKLYLLPDPAKATKKKTKIARKTLNPTYNEVVS